MSAGRLIVHPMREGVRTILKKHFGEEIAKKFVLEFEGAIFNKDNESIWRQLKSDKQVMEVRYENEPDLYEFVCDLYTWESPRLTELRLLQAVKDKWKQGKIGKDWQAKSGRISIAVTPTKEVAS